MKFLKSTYWIWICCILIAVCLGVGFATKGSYINLSANWKQASYFNPLTQQEEFQITDVQTCMEDAEIIVSAKAVKESSYISGGFVTDMEITQVYKGAPSLEKNTIAVVEPIGLIQQESKNTGLVVTAFSNSSYGYRTKIGSEKEYILFLKAVFPEEKQTEMPYYILVENSYAKLIRSDVTENNYQKPMDVLSLEDSISYEILLTDSNEVQNFFRGKQQLLSLLK